MIAGKDWNWRLSILDGFSSIVRISFECHEDRGGNCEACPSTVSCVGGEEEWGGVLIQDELSLGESGAVLSEGEGI